MGVSREDDFDEFYRGTIHRVVHVVYAATGDLTLAQDSAQEAYLKAWSNWDDVNAMNDPVAWVRTVARRTAISRWRSSSARDRAQHRQARAQDSSRSDSDQVTDRVAVLEALRNLSEDTRMTLALHYLADKSVDDIAEELGAPPGTIKARLHRGRAQLAELLRDSATPDNPHPYAGSERPHA